MVRGHKIGEVVSVGDQRMRIPAQGGFIEVSRVRLDDGQKIPATEADVSQRTISGSSGKRPKAGGRAAVRNKPPHTAALRSPS